MNFKSTEARELQDMYRRTLSASFAAQAGELPADECIESLFAGGDGWRDKHEMNVIPTESRDKPPHHRRPSSQDTGSIRAASSSSLLTVGGGRSSSYHRRVDSRQRDNHERQSSRESLSGAYPRRSSSHGSIIMHDGRSTSASANHGMDESIGSSRGGRHGDTIGVGVGGGGGNSSNHNGGGGDGQIGEVDELDIREDLRSWTLPISG